MREVSVTLQFVTPCLGNERGETADKFLRDPSTGRVIFLNSWWCQLLDFGAQGLGRFQSLVSNIFFDMYVDGPVKAYKRFYRQDAYKLHEAYLAGDKITVKAKLPAELGPAELRLILAAAGRYRGFSPYGWRKGFGRFVVVAIEGEAKTENDESNRRAGGECPESDSAL